MPEVRPDIAHLAERTTGQAGNARTQRKSIGIHAGSVHTHARGNRTVLRDAAHKQTQACAADQPGHAQQNGNRKANDDQAVVRQ